MPSIVLITGATDGLGRAVARDAVAAGATVIVHGRSRERAEATVRELREAAGPDCARLVLADFSRLEEVRRMAEQVRREEPRLDVLVNNAGIGAGGRDDGGRRESADGIELRFQVNYLAPFLLTQLLLPLLEASAPARIVNVASAGQAPLDFDDPLLERGYDGLRAYGQSKLAQISFTLELAGRLGDGRVTVNALHPASLMDTKMVRESFGRPRSTIAEGAAATERLALAPGLARLTGRYFDGRREARAHPQAYDPEARRRLWQLSEELAGLRERAPDVGPAPGRPAAH